MTAPKALIPSWHRREGAWGIALKARLLNLGEPFVLLMSYKLLTQSVVQCSTVQVQVAGTCGGSEVDVTPPRT